MDEWKLEKLALRFGGIARGYREAWPSFATFFDNCVEALQQAPFARPNAFREMHRRADDRIKKAGRLLLLLPGGEAWQARQEYTPEERQIRATYLASVGVVRSLARSGFLAFGGMQVESVGAHRRTLEGLRHLEILQDRPDLASSYEELANEAMRDGRKNNAFKSAADNVNKLIGNDKSPAKSLTPLQRMLMDRASYANLHAGAHAGAQHAVAGLSDEDLDRVTFYDSCELRVGFFAIRYGWETVQLCNVLMPKLDWVDGSQWSRRYKELRDEAREIETEQRKIDGKLGDALPPWSSLLTEGGS